MGKPSANKISDGKAPAARPKRLALPLADLPGIGKRRVVALRRLGLVSVADLLRHYPLRYEKLAAEGLIADLPTDGKTVGSARGVVMNVRWVGTLGFGKKGRFEATLQGEGTIGRRSLLLTWFNAAYLRERLVPGLQLRVQGKAKLFNEYPQMVNPKWEILPDEPEQSPAEQVERLRPIYPAAAEVPATLLERLTEDVLTWSLPMVPDPVPPALIQHLAMPSLAEALRMIHRPRDAEEPKAARRRLAYNELLILQLAIAVRRAEVEQRCIAPALPWSPAIDTHIRQRFPFALTDTQSNAVREIAADLQQARPMNRMLQGDVGSGKTVIALYAMLLAVADRRQAALMAPTELLAEQHFLSIARMLAGSNVKVVLITGRQRSDVAAAGETDPQQSADLIIGTHALLSASVRFRDLAVVVIDEQHRFGVVQRSVLRQGSADDNAKQRMPHTLVMTATPIPRSLSLTLFGDLDNTTLTGLPPGRTPIDNRVVGPEKSDEVYQYLRKRLERGEQAYVVVPAIEPRTKQKDGALVEDMDSAADEGISGATSGGGGGSLKNVTEHAALLQQRFFAGYKVASVHGRLKPESRQRVMERFRAGKVQVLVATTVIEVGVDVPNATLMVVEHAERFGLSQLHQLRGRVGRGTSGRRSLCVFVAEPTTEEAIARMDAIASTGDGFKIAELDLQIRGMGNILGTRQSGAPPMRLAEIPGDLDLLQQARRDAAAIVKGDPQLQHEEHRLLRRILIQQYGNALGLVDVG